MKTSLAVFAAVAVFATISGGAQAKGCLKGAVVGGIGGHVAGHHTVLGAAAGCAVGHSLAKKKEKEAAIRQSAPARREPAADAPVTPRDAPKNWH